jgi:hypothetical protein
VRKYLAGALIGAFMLTGAVTAWAVSSAQTTHNVNFTTGHKREGTPRNPRPNSLRITLDQGTTTGTDQPATTTTINVALNRQWRLNSELWPQRRRCSIQKVNQQGTDSVCPRGSKVGSGSAVLLAGGGGISEDVNVRAHVIKNGDLGFFLDSPPGEPTEINNMIQGVTSRLRRISIKIPDELQNVAGLKSSIDKLSFRLAASAPIRGERRGIVETTGCRRGRWSFTLESIYDDGGSNKDSDRVTC